MGQEPQCVLTLPLLEGTDGIEKMSKSLNNDVGLTDEPNEMFGKLMSIPDEVMWKYFKIVTQIEPVEIEKIRNDVESGSMNPRDAKERLARELVKTYYSQVEAESASEEFRRVFSQKGLPDEIRVASVPLSRFHGGNLWVVDLLVSLGVASTKGEARRLIDGGGIYIDGIKVADCDLELTTEELSGKVIRKGRKTFLEIEITDE